MITPLDHPLQVLLFGPPGSRKTVRAHTFPRTRTLDFDNGMLSVAWACKKGIIQNGAKYYKKVGECEPGQETYAIIQEPRERGSRGFVAEPHAIDAASDQLDVWLKPEIYPTWDTLVIDSATSLNEFCVLMGASQMTKMGLSKTGTVAASAHMWLPRIQDYGGAKSLFKQFIDWCRSLDKNLVVIAHEYEKTTDSGGLLAYQPLLIGSLRTEIPKDFDEVWHAEVNKKGDSIIRTVGDRRHECKSRLGCLDEEEEAFTYAQIMRKVEKFWK